MTRKHYILMLTLIIIVSIIHLPYTLPEIPIFKEWLKDYKFSIYLITQIGVLFFWISLLYYFHLKYWKFSFYSGIFLAIASSSLSYFVQFRTEGFESTTVVIMGILTLLYLISSILYSLSFLTSSRTKNHSLIRIYAIGQMLALFVIIFGSFFQEINQILISAFISIAESILLFLHFVRERNNDYRLVQSDEILDSEH
ncbi:MAG: hypothetical protein GQ574_24280 [Crocinitomix sp.]|nr:hypothetical protein [Crocinitomix sp.]